MLKRVRVLIYGSTSGIRFGAAEAAIENGADKAAYPSSRIKIEECPCDPGNLDIIEDNIKDLFAKAGELDHIVYSAGRQSAPETLQDIRFNFHPAPCAKPEEFYSITTGATNEKPWTGSAVVGSWLSGLQGGIDTALWDYKNPEKTKAVIDELTRDTTVGVIGTVDDVAEAYIY